MPTEVSDELAHKLAYSNLLHVFSNRDAASRREAIKATYHPDVTFFEPDVQANGHDAVEEKAAELLAGRAGWGFVPRGAVKKNHDLVYLAWGFGPVMEDGEVDVKGTGADVLIIEGDKIKRFWVIIDGIADVRV